MHYIIIRVENQQTAELLALSIRERFLALRDYRIGDVEDTQLIVDTLIENMDKVVTLVNKDD